MNVILQIFLQTFHCICKYKINRENDRHAAIIQLDSFQPLGIIIFEDKNLITW
jgi:hypothetical protein